MFTDANGDGAIGGGDQLLRSTGAIHASTTLVAANLSTAGRIQFRPTGMASGVTGGGATFTLCDDRTAEAGRLITVAATGRASSAINICP